MQTDLLKGKRGLIMGLANDKSIAWGIAIFYLFGNIEGLGRYTGITNIPPITVGEGAFVQVIEFSTSRLPEFQELEDGWREAIGDDRTARWAITGADRNEPDRYLQIVGFPDYEAAMANSKNPATGRFAEELRAVCDGDAAFHDLDVRRVQAF